MGDDYDKAISRLDAYEDQRGSLRVSILSLIKEGSIDVLGTSTRDVWNKLITFASIGVLVSTIAKVEGTVDTPIIKITISDHRMFKFFLIFAIGYYAIGIIILYMSDYKRWNAVRNLNIDQIRDAGKRFKKLEEEMRADLQLVRDREAWDDHQVLVGGMMSLVNDAVDSRDKLNSQSFFSLLIFVLMPLIFAVFSIILLIRP